MCRLTATSNNFYLLGVRAVVKMKIIPALSQVKNLCAYTSGCPMPPLMASLKATGKWARWTTDCSCENPTQQVGQTSAAKPMPPEQSLGKKVNLEKNDEQDLYTWSTSTRSWWSSTAGGSSISYTVGFSGTPAEIIMPTLFIVFQQLGAPLMCPVHWL